MIANPQWPKRIWTNYFSTLANTNAQTFTMVTNDDYRDRYVETLFVGLSVSGLSVALFTTGQEYSIIDTTRFAAGDPVLRVEMRVPAKLSLMVQFTDLNGAARTNVPVVVGYRVDPTTGP